MNERRVKILYMYWFETRTTMFYSPVNSLIFQIYQVTNIVHLD